MSPLAGFVVAWCLLLTFPAPVLSTDGVEVFDVDQGAVVRMLPNSLALQEEVRSWITSSKGIATQLRLDPESGLGMKIPLSPPLRLETHPWVRGTAVEAILFVSRSPAYPPTLLLLKADGGLSALRVSKDLRPFLQSYELYDAALYTGP
jgi:hypothetical protein